MDPNTQDRPIQNVLPPVSPQVPPSRGWIKWVVLIIITVILASGGTYLLIQFQSQNSSKPIVQAPISPTPTPDPIANWKTYTNNSFTFKYPSDWLINRNEIKSSSPNIRIYIAEDESLMNECMEEVSINKQNSFFTRKFRRVVIDAMCGGGHSTARELWVIPKEDAYGPGIIIYYSAKEEAVIEPIFNQILSTFKFLKNKTENVKISGEYSFDIQIPTTYSIKKNENDNSLTKDAAHIYDDQNKEVLFIYTYAAGERTPVGNLTIDGVPFTINYFKDIQCLADLDATNWVPGTKPLFGIHIRCDKANQEQLDQYKTIIQSITFSPALKNILLGNVHN